MALDASSSSSVGPGVVNGRATAAARHRQNALWLGFTMSAASLLFLVSGFIGYNLSRRERLLNGTA